MLMLLEGSILKQHFGDKALAIFVKPPSIEALAERLRTRDTETEESIARRMAKASQEMDFAQEFDIILLNDNLDQAKKEAFDLVSEFLEA